MGDVDDIVEYFILFREIISQIIAQYQLSGKRKHALEELAQLLNGFVALPLHVMPMTRMFRRTTQTGCICAGI